MRGLLAGLGLAVALTAGAAHADWRDNVKVLRVGFLAPGDPVRDRKHMEPFRAYLEERIALPVELVPATTYSALIDGMIAGRTQYGLHSATSFAAAEAACTCLEPLAVPAAFDGAKGFHSVLLARSDGSIQSLADAKGRRLAVSGEDSVAGRLVPFAGLEAEGIDPQTYFSRVETVAGPEAAVTALVAGGADVAAAWSSLAGDAATGYSFGVLQRMMLDGRLMPGAVRVIWQSPLIPFGPHAVRTDVPPELKLLLANALFAMGLSAPDVLEAVDRSGIGGGGFVPVTAADYAVIAGLVAKP